MPKITEISQVLQVPNGCPFESVAAVLQDIYPIGPKQRGEGKYGPWTMQNISLRDRTAHATVKATLWNQPEMSKQSKGQAVLIEAGEKGGLSVKENSYKGKTEMQLEVKGGCTVSFLRSDGTVEPQVAAAPPPAVPQARQEPPDHLAGDPVTSRPANTPQTPVAAPEGISVTMPTPAQAIAQAIAQVKEGMKRPALAILLCLEKVDEILAARSRRLHERLEKLETASEEAAFVHKLVVEADEPNPALKLELLRSLLIQGGQCGLWDLLPCVSLSKPTPPPVEAPVPEAPVAPAAPAVQLPANTLKAPNQKVKHPGPGEPGYNIEFADDICPF